MASASFLCQLIWSWDNITTRTIENHLYFPATAKYFHDDHKKLPFAYRGLFILKTWKMVVI